ncbi:MAG: TauD/TfdA family dioxygenase [Actinomycetota bacterium]|nr:TauD/TfdA family dioxygenase [Actinomycetota bacterium]
MEIQKITGNIGAEITDIDLANVSDEEIGEIKKAWLDHKVLVLRDQHITEEEHIAFGRKFGELEIHPFARGGHVGLGNHPELLRIASNAEREFAAVKWHSDVTWREEPSMGSILRGVVIPETGGDTCFASAAAAYESLPSDVKSQIDDLYAIHDFTVSIGEKYTLEERLEKQKEYPPVRHPVVRTHPETGERSIYTNGYHTSHIEGVSDEESDKILATLELAMLSPTVQFRLKWEKDTFVMWDNRSTQHAVAADFYPAERIVERVTIIGDRPF